MTAPMRLRWEEPSGDPAEGQPRLHDFVAEIAEPYGDPDELERAFLVVGVEEPAREGGRWKVMYERLAWPPDRIDWCFYRDAR